MHGGLRGARRSSDDGRPFRDCPPHTYASSPGELEVRLVSTPGRSAAKFWTAPEPSKAARPHPGRPGLRLTRGLASSLPRGLLEPASGIFQIVPRVNPGVRALGKETEKKKKKKKSSKGKTKFQKTRSCIQGRLILWREEAKVTNLNIRFFF